MGVASAESDSALAAASVAFQQRLEEDLHLEVLGGHRSGTSLLLRPRLLVPPLALREIAEGF